MVGHFTYLALNGALITIIDGDLVFHFPSSNFHASVDINSQRGIEPHSLETTIGLESINLTVDLMRELVSRLKPKKATKPPATPPSSLSPTISSPFPMSPSIHFMVSNLTHAGLFRSHHSLAIASWVCRKERSQ